MDWTGRTSLLHVSAREIPLPGGRSTVVWDCPGPPEAPTLVLLHGATLTSALNWGGVVGSLSRHFRVVLLDQRGHGAGARLGASFLEDCADDVAAVAEELGIHRLVPVGYSMGGLIAQLVWRRHPDLVSGLVLCSTARNVSGSPWEQSVALMMPSLVTATMWLPGGNSLRADLLGNALLDHSCDPSDRAWALSEMRRTSLVHALSAMQAVCEFTSHRWIGEVDVPTSVVLTRHDHIVPARRQWKLARALPDSTVVEVDGGHDVFLESPGTFAAALDNACSAVCGGTVATAIGA